MHSFCTLFMENTSKLILSAVFHFHNSKLTSNDRLTQLEAMQGLKLSILSAWYAKLCMLLHTYLEIRRWHNTTQPKLFSHRADSVNVLQWVLKFLFCWVKDRCFDHLSWTSQTGKVRSVAWFTRIARFCFLRIPAKRTISLCTLLCVEAYASRHDL